MLDPLTINLWETVWKLTGFPVTPVAPGWTPWDPRLHHVHRVCLSGLSLMVSSWGVSDSEGIKKNTTCLHVYRVIFCFEICMTCFVSNLFSCTTTVKPPKMEQEEDDLSFPFKGWVWGSHVSLDNGWIPTLVILKKSLEFQGGAPKEFLRKPHHDDLPVFLSFIMDPTKGEDESSCIIIGIKGKEKSKSIIKWSHDRFFLKIQGSKEFPKISNDSPFLPTPFFYHFRNCKFAAFPVGSIKIAESKLLFSDACLTANLLICNWGVCAPPMPHAQQPSIIKW